MNVDTLRTNEPIYNTIENITRIKIDIACIQETNNERNDIIINDYEIFFGGSGTNMHNNNTNNQNNQTGGMAIAIHKTLTNNIQKIIRINGRIMEIILKLV